LVPHAYKCLSCIVAFVESKSLLMNYHPWVVKLLMNYPLWVVELFSTHVLLKKYLWRLYDVYDVNYMTLTKMLLYWLWYCYVAMLFKILIMILLCCYDVVYDTNYNVIMLFTMLIIIVRWWLHWVVLNLLVMMITWWYLWVVKCTWWCLC